MPLGVGDKLSRHGPSAYRTKRQRTIRLMGILGPSQDGKAISSEDWKSYVMIGKITLTNCGD